MTRRNAPVFGLLGCTDPHSWDCMAPFEPDCPLYSGLLTNHMNGSYWGMKATESKGMLTATHGLHNTWAMDCQDPPCPAHRERLIKTWGQPPEHKDG